MDEEQLDLSEGKDKIERQQELLSRLDKLRERAEDDEELGRKEFRVWRREVMEHQDFDLEGRLHAVKLIERVMFPNQVLGDLEGELEECKECKLHKNRRNLVFGSGEVPADVLFLGEAPGETENKVGEPFVGKAGKLLRKWLRQANLDLDYYITNTVKCRPPNNRNPEEDETEACRSYLSRQIQIVDPWIVVTLGRVPLNWFFPGHSVTKRRGNLYFYRDKSYSGFRLYVYPTFHPAATFYGSDKEELIKQDLDNLKRVYYESRFGDLKGEDLV